MKWKLIRLGVMRFSAVLLCLAILLFPIQNSHLPKAEADNTWEEWLHQDCNVNSQTTTGVYEGEIRHANGSLTVVTQHQNGAPSNSTVISVSADANFDFTRYSYKYTVQLKSDSGIVLSEKSVVLSSMPSNNSDIVATTTIVNTTNTVVYGSYYVSRILNTSPALIITTPSPNQSFG